MGERKRQIIQSSDCIWNSTPYGMGITIATNMINIMEYQGSLESYTSHLKVS